MTNTPDQNTVIDIERAITELRHGQPITIFERGEGLLIQTIEGLDDNTLTRFRSLVKEDLFIVISKTRGHVLYPHEEIKRPIKLPLGTLSLQSIKGVAGISFQEEGYVLPYVYAGGCSSTAIELIKHAKTIPAILVSHIRSTENLANLGIYNVTFSAIENYPQALAQALTPIVTSPLTLKNAMDASITVYRGKPGIQEHYLITVGNPAGQESPVVRIHSSCFTGDLLGSLKCDCGQQLQESLHYMSQNNGGYVLYLNQEGRGIGLANKLRAYALQADGMDTVQANEYLGFEDDERPFLPAAYMLKHLGIDSVKLITNNPRKINGLEDLGITVAERLPIVITPHEHNADYLKTKFSKLGHIDAT